MIRRRGFEQKALWFAAIGLLGFQLALNSMLRRQDAAWLLSPNEGAERWSPDLYKVVSFGHLPVAVDWLFLKFISDPAYAKVPKGTHPPIYYDLQLATDLDPAFFDLYVLGANLLSVIRDDGPGARDLLLKGKSFQEKELVAYPESFRNQYWSQAWYLSLSLAYVYLFELDDMPKAAAEFDDASRLPNAPYYLKSLAERLQRPGGQYDVGLRLLNFLIDGSTTEEAKEKLVRRRESLRVAKYLYDVNEGFLVFTGKKSPAKPPRGIPFERLQALWGQYQKETPAAVRDPWGGTLSLGSEGKVVTSTPHDKVMGLE